MLPVAILAGGLATRLRPLTDRVPKSLLPVAGRPFLFHQLDLLKAMGAARVVLCVGHLSEQIQAAVGRGRSFGLEVDYAFDGGEPKGTGGALKQALGQLAEAFFVLNGDSYLTCSLVEIESAFRRSGRPALMTVLRNDNRWDRSNVLFKDGTLAVYDKQRPRTDMAHIDFGISVVSSSVFSSYPASVPLDLSDIWRDLASRGDLAGLEVFERFYEIGSARGLLETDAFLSRRTRVAGNA